MPLNGSDKENTIHLTTLKYFLQQKVLIAKIVIYLFDQYSFLSKFTFVTLFPAKHDQYLRSCSYFLSLTDFIFPNFCENFRGPHRTF